MQVAEPPAIPPLRDLRYRLEYAVLRLLIGFVRLFPIDAAGTISAKAWRLIAPLNRRHKRALANLERAFPDKTPQERERIALRGRLIRTATFERRADQAAADPFRDHRRPVVIVLTDRTVRLLVRPQFLRATGDREDLEPHARDDVELVDVNARGVA